MGTRERERERERESRKGGVRERERVERPARLAFLDCRAAR